MPPPGSRVHVAAALAALLAVCAAAEPAASLTACRAAGFEPGALACSTCATLASALEASAPGVSDIEDDCSACCSSTLDLNSATRFARASLLACRQSLGNHPGVAEFLEKGAAKARAKLTDEPGMLPTLVLSGGGAAGAAGGRDGEQLRVVVAGWKVEAIDAFLARRLL